MYLHKNNKKFLFILMVLMSSGTFIWGMDFNNQKIGGRQKESGHGVDVLPMPTVVPLEAVPVVQAQRVQSEVVQRGLVVSDGERFRCKFDGCGHVAKCTSNLKSHARTHTGEKSYMCGIDGCTYATAKNGDLKKHKRTHTGEKPYKCSIDGCKYATIYKSGLGSHIASKHTSYMCGIDGCDYMATVQRDLNKHIKTHTSKKVDLGGLYVCSQCGNNFESGPMIDRHKREAHRKNKLNL